MRRKLSLRFVKSKFIRVNSDFICDKSIRKLYSTLTYTIWLAFSNQLQIEKKNCLYQIKKYVPTSNQWRRYLAQLPPGAAV